MQIFFNIVELTQKDIKIPLIPRHETTCEIVVTDERNLSPILLTKKDRLKILVKLIRIIEEVNEQIPVTYLYIHNAIDLSRVFGPILQKFNYALGEKSVLLHTLSEEEVIPYITNDRVLHSVTNETIESTLSVAWSKLRQTFPFTQLSKEEKTAVQLVRAAQKSALHYGPTRDRRKKIETQNSLEYRKSADRNLTLRTQINKLADEIFVLKESVGTSPAVRDFMRFFKSPPTYTALPHFQEEASLDQAGLDEMLSWFEGAGIIPGTGNMV